MPNDTDGTKRRSGTETRQRTHRVNLRLLPEESDALRILARQRGLASVQALIIETLQPLIMPDEAGRR
jgi:hypothetical protein